MYTRSTARTISAKEYFISETEEKSKRVDYYSSRAAVERVFAAVVLILNCRNNLESVATRNHEKPTARLGSLT